MGLLYVIMLQTSIYAGAELPAYKSGRTPRLLVRAVSLSVSSGHLLLCFRVTDLTPHIIRRSNPTEK